MNHQAVYTDFSHMLPIKPDELDIAYAVEETMIQHRLDEVSVRWIIDNESEAVYGD